MRRLAGLLGFMFVLCVAAASSRAEETAFPLRLAAMQTPEPPPPPGMPTEISPPPPARLSEKQAIEEAKAHFQKGLALYNDGNFEGSLAEFDTAYALRPSTGVLYNIGLTQKSLFRYPESIDSLEKYLKEDKKIPHERRMQVQQLIKEMRELLADISIYVDPDGATVMIDGRPAGKSPLRPVPLPAGRHVIDVSAEGYKPTKKEIMVSAQKAMPVQVKLEALPKSGKVRIIASHPGAKVAIDGKDMGYAPVEVELPGGSHRLSVSAPVYATNTSDLVITPGQALRVIPVKLEMPTTESKFYHKWWFWTIVGVAATGATVGTIAALSKTESPIPGTIPGIATVP